MNYKIKNTYEVTQAQEFSVDCGGFNYLVIYGHHINGGFIAIPNWNISVEAGDPTDVFYNAEKLAEKVSDPEVAEAIAEAVKEHWKTTEKFTAKECNFQGKPGYMVSQFHDGQKVTEQFIPKSVYKSYCKAADIQPEIINGREGENQKPHRAEHIHEREER